MTLQPLQLRPGERVVWSGKPTVLAFYDALLGGALLIAVSIIVAILWPHALLALSAVGSLFGASLIALAFAVARANTYTVTDRRVVRRFQLVVVVVDEAPIEKVTNVVLEQGVVGRIFGFGDIRFDTAGTAFRGVLFKGVKRPEEVKRVIDEGLQASQASTRVTQPSQPSST